MHVWCFPDSSCFWCWRCWQWVINPCLPAQSVGCWSPRYIYPPFLVRSALLRGSENNKIYTPTIDNRWTRWTTIGENLCYFKFLPLQAEHVLCLCLPDMSHDKVYVILLMSTELWNFVAQFIKMRYIFGLRTTVWIEINTLWVLIKQTSLPNTRNALSSKSLSCPHLRVPKTLLDHSKDPAQAETSDSIGLYISTQDLASLIWISGCWDVVLLCRHCIRRVCHWSRTVSICRIWDCYNKRQEKQRLKVKSMVVACQPNQAQLLEMLVLT